MYKTAQNCQNLNDFFSLCLLSAESSHINFTQPVDLRCVHNYLGLHFGWLQYTTIYYNSVEQKTCIQNAYIIKSLQKYKIDGSIIIAIPVHDYVNVM